MRSGEILLVSVVALVCACGEVVRPEDADTADARSDTEPPDVNVDAGPVRPSVVQLGQTSDPTARPSTFLLAAIYGPEPDGNPFQLTTSSAGPCMMTRSAGSSPRSSSMGRLTVTWTGGTLTAEPPATGSYFASTPAGAWPPGTMLSVSAAGDVVANFARTLTMPAMLGVTRPDPTSTGNVAIPVAQPFQVEWTPLPDSDVEADLRAIYIDQGTMRYANVYCSFAGSAGSGVIPAEALSILTGASNTTLSIAARSTSLLDVNGTSVKIVADNISLIRAVDLR